MNIGTNAGNKFSYPIENLKKHFVSLGASGSGKTVLTKAIIEECMLQGIPGIVIDVQGDLCSLAKIVPEHQKELAKVDVNIYTPISSKGIPLSLNPFSIQPDGNEEELIPIIHSQSTAIAKLLGYNTDNDKGKFAESIIYTLLKDSFDNNQQIKSFEELKELLANPTKKIRQSLSIGSKSENETLLKKIHYMTIGEKKMLFSYGESLNIKNLLKKNTLSVIYLNTLTDQKEKEFYLTNIVTQLYQWMLNNPSDKLQALFVVDEIAPFIPAGSDKPMPKPALKLLFKQARKYGVGCVIATQNPGDIDYKAMAQFGTWAMGRMTVKQDIKKVESALKSLSSVNVSDKLPQLKPGEFKLFAPDVSDKIIDLKVRWLYTEHLTLDEDKINELMKDKIKPIKRQTHKTSKITKDEVEIPIKILKERKSEKKYIVFPCMSDKEAYELALSHRKKFLKIGKPIEQLDVVKQKTIPLYKLTVRAHEKIALIKTKKDYTLFFDGITGSLVKIDEKHHLNVETTARLLSITNKQLEVAKIVMTQGPITESEIRAKTGKPPKSLLKALHKESFIQNKKYKGIEKWSSLNPFDKKYVFQVASHDTTGKGHANPLKPKISLASIKSFVLNWFEDVEIKQIETAYRTDFVATYSKKGVSRKLTFNGTTKKLI